MLHEKVLYLFHETAVLFQLSYHEFTSSNSTGTSLIGSERQRASVNEASRLYQSTDCQSFSLEQVPLAVLLLCPNQLAESPQCDSRLLLAIQRWKSD